MAIEARLDEQGLLLSLSLARSMHFSPLTRASQAYATARVIELSHAERTSAPFSLSLSLYLYLSYRMYSIIILQKGFY